MARVFRQPLCGRDRLARLLVTGILGCGAAWLSGRAIAATWRPIWHVAHRRAPLGAAARFIHFALFEGKLLSLSSLRSDTGIFLIVGLVAFRATRSAQMVRQYPWLYARCGPLSWREIEQENSRRDSAKFGANHG